MLWGRLISIRSLFAAAFRKSFSSASASKIAPSRVIADAASQVRHVVTFSLPMATVLGYGHLRRSRSEVNKEEEETDREIYLRLSQSSGSGDKYHEVLKRYFEEGRALELFQIWKEEHKKVYKDAEEENNRFLLFESRLKWIVERGPAHSYSLVLIDCSDRTQEELKKLFPTTTRQRRDSFEELISMVRQYKLLHSRGNLRSLCLAINHRLTRPGSSRGTTGFGNYQSFSSITTKNTFFKTPRPNITTMPYAPRQTPPRPLKEFHSLPSRGNNIGIATILGSQWETTGCGSIENYLYTTSKNSLFPDVAMSYAPNQSAPRPLHQCNSLPSNGNSIGIAGQVNATKNSGPRNPVPVGGHTLFITSCRSLEDLNDLLGNTAGILKTTSKGFPSVSGVSSQGVVGGRK